MSPLLRVLAACAVAACGLGEALAATVCVLNKQTGRLEPLAAGSADSCAPAASRFSNPSGIAGHAARPEAVQAASQSQPAAGDAAMRRDWVLKADYQTLEEAIEAFAARVDYEVVYEAREFPLDLKRDMTIAANADFWEALRVLGEAYRKSDAAFQILPTRFRQIVVLPMGQESTGGQP